MESFQPPSGGEGRPQMDLETLVFLQLLDWLESKGPCLQGYEPHLSVAPRRGQLQSKVWCRARDGKLVVLKTFSRLELKSVQRAILNEIVVPFVVDSPRILKPTDFFLEKEVPLIQIFYLEFPFQEGADLRHLLTKVKPHKLKQLNEEILRGYFRTVTEGVRDLHAKGFIYRDLKPDNVLVSRDGGLLLTDFEFSIHMHLGPDDVALFFLVWTAQRFEWDFRLAKKQLAGLRTDWFDGELLLSEHFKVSLDAWHDDSLAQLLEFFNSEEKEASVEDSPVEPLSRDLSFRKMQNVKSSRKDPLNAASHARQRPEDGEDPAMQKIVFKETRITGSLEYLAPEVLERNFYSVSSDVWALGCLVYDLFYRKALFLSEANWTSSEQKKLFYCEVVGHFDPALCKTRRMSREAADLFRKLLTYNPYDRLGVRDLREVLAHPWLGPARAKYPAPYLPVNREIFSADDPDAFFIYNVFYDFNRAFQEAHSARRAGAKKPLLRIQAVPSWNRGPEAQPRLGKPSTPLSIRLRTAKEKPLQLSLVESKESFRKARRGLFTSNDFKKSKQSFWKTGAAKQKTYTKLPSRRLRINPRSDSRAKRTSLNFRYKSPLFSPSSSGGLRGFPKQGFKAALKSAKNRARFNSNDSRGGRRLANFTLRKFRLNSDEVPRAPGPNFEFQARTKPLKRNFFKIGGRKEGVRAKLKGPSVPTMQSLEGFWKDPRPQPMKTSLFQKKEPAEPPRSKAKQKAAGKMFMTSQPKKNLTLPLNARHPRKVAQAQKPNLTEPREPSRQAKGGLGRAAQLKGLRQKYLGSRLENRSESGRNPSGGAPNFYMSSKLKLRSGKRKTRGLNSLGEKPLKF